MARPDVDDFIDVSEEIAEGEEGEAYGRSDGPDSQGERAGEGFGRNAQGGAGDEDFDPSYQRDHDDGTLGTPPLCDNDPDDQQVRVDDGVVVLVGDVDDPAVPERAEQIAAAVSGVQSVTNRIRVRRGEDEG
jgi:hypothetical protein